MSKGIINAWHNFLKTNFNVIMRNSPNIYKERKYAHVDIRQRFEDVEKERRKQRLTLMEYRKSLKLKLLKNQLDFLSKNKEIAFISDEGLKKELADVSDIKSMENIPSYTEYIKSLIESQKNETNLKSLEGIKTEDKSTYMVKINEELKKLETELVEIKEMRKELEGVDKAIEELEPTHILVTGIQKKIVLNMITYYEFQSRNLHGFTINPETMKAIENVHYHVDHNLPIRREVRAKFTFTTIH